MIIDIWIKCLVTIKLFPIKLLLLMLIKTSIIVNLFLSTKPLNSVLLMLKEALPDLVCRYLWIIIVRLTLHKERLVHLHQIVRSRWCGRCSSIVVLLLLVEEILLHVLLLLIDELLLLSLLLSLSLNVIHALLHYQLFLIQSTGYD